MDLLELIYRCGKKFDSLTRIDNGWLAVGEEAPDQKGLKARDQDENKAPTGLGNTPCEAVENLIIKLKKIHNTNVL